MTKFQIFAWVAQLVWLGLTWRKSGFLAALNVLLFAVFCGFLLGYSLDRVDLSPAR